MVQQADGSMQQVYPALKYGGAHLGNPVTEKRADIIELSIKGLIVAFVFWSILWAAIAILYARNKCVSIASAFGIIFSGKAEYPLRSIAITTGIIIAIIAVSMILGSHYHFIWY